MYREAFLEMREPALILDSSFEIVEISEGVVEEFGYSSSELLGVTPDELFVSKKRAQEMANTIHQGETWLAHPDIETAGGRSVYTRATAVRLTSPSASNGYLASFSLLSEQRQYKQALEVFRRVFRHNLKNDMNVAMGYLQAARSELGGREESIEEYLDVVSQYLDEVMDNAEIARKLEDILMEGNSGSGRTTIRLDTIVRTQAIKLDSKYGSATVNVDNLPPSEPLAGQFVGHVVEELIENAIIHNDSPDPRVDIDIVTQPKQVLLAISDNGPGIPDDQKDIVFGRGDRSQTKHTEGMGLFFVDQSIRAIGGDVWVEDNEPTGSIFVVRFPRGR